MFQSEFGDEMPWFDFIWLFLLSQYFFPIFPYRERTEGFNFQPVNNSSLPVVSRRIEPHSQLQLYCGQRFPIHKHIYEGPPLLCMLCGKKDVKSTGGDGLRPYRRCGNNGTALLLSSSSLRLLLLPTTTTTLRHRGQVWFFLNQTRIQSLWNTWEQQGSRRMIPSPPTSSARHTAHNSSSQLPPSHFSDFNIRTSFSDSPTGPPKSPLSSSKDKKPGSGIGQDISTVQSASDQTVGEFAVNLCWVQAKVMDEYAGDKGKRVLVRSQNAAVIELFCSILDDRVAAGGGSCLRFVGHLYAYKAAAGKRGRVWGAYQVDRI
ncbi:hypothetical protein DM860_005363 [Cuscuta australis]|uniref:Uncharacterized protein n=1 Tax=Cuscuta australis TaxID=267555 RepID=A0A328DZ90_9ASTE|nr:hypothetical protein DM860_005363 [Cuscuta australis]